MALIKLKRGNKANLPTTASQGEPLLAIDTGELYYGDNSGNRQPIKVDKTNVILGTDLFLSAADKAKLDGIAASADNVESSSTNGNIKINGVETPVYTHPANHAASMITATVSGITGTEVSTILANLKNYIDSAVNGLDLKQSCRVASTANIATLSGLLTIDGVTVVAGDRVLVKDQSTGSANGIYIAASGAWTRATDCDANAEVTAGMFIFVEEGTSNQDTGWVLTTNGTITIGTTALTFQQFTGLGQIVAGTGLTKTGNTISIANSGVAAGTYPKVTVNAQGQVTNGASLSASDIPSLDTSKLTTGTLPIARGGTGAASLTANQLVRMNSGATALESSGKTIDDFAPASHVGSTGTAHGAATTSVNGFMSASDKSKLDGIASGANNYTHPTGDGYLHVPATDTTNSGKVLTAGATAGSLSWQPTVSSLNVGNNKDGNFLTTNTITGNPTIEFDGDQFINNGSSGTTFRIRLGAIDGGAF